jgi:putative flippase GtrA
MRIRRSFIQLVRYGVIGLANNSIGYLIYLLLTHFGATPKVTMSILYVVGATIGFWGNRKLAFEYKGDVMGSGTRYVITHCLGYLVNLSILFVMVDKLGYPHQWVQAAAIFIVAGFLFLMFKFFVFTEADYSPRTHR